MASIPVDPGSFLMINREERFFCSLLTHAVLASQCLRSAFFGRVNELCGSELRVEPDKTEVYSEAAWLRDHWRNLGDPSKWTPELEAARIEMLSSCLKAVHGSLQQVKNEKFFRTQGKVPKVVTPGRWPLADLAHDELKTLKWAFNAIPDFVFVSGSAAVILEAKVESKPAKLSNGYSQESVQAALCQLLPAVAPYLDASRVGRLWLAPSHVAHSDAPSMLWSEVATMVSKTPRHELDGFAREGLEKFTERAKTGDVVLD
jgi:hypothetical protein